MAYDPEVLKKLNTSTDKLIELTTKKLELMKEFKKALIYEQCTYDLTKPGTQPYYMLYQISGHKLLASGSISIIKGYINIRSIDTDTIYNYSNIIK